MPHRGANRLPEGNAAENRAIDEPPCWPAPVRRAAVPLDRAACVVGRLQHTTGCMTTAEVIELSDLNFAEAMRDLSRRAGGVVHDADGVMLFAGGHPLPVLANGVMRTGSRLGPSDVLAQAREFFAVQRRGFSVLIREHADADLADHAAAAGLLPLGDMPAMILDHRLPEAVAPAGVDLRP